MKARGQTKKIIETVMRIQYLIGMAKGCHEDDRDPDGHEKGQKALGEAFELCLEITGMYEPLSIPATPILKGQDLVGLINDLKGPDKGGARRERARKLLGEVAGKGV